MKCMYNICMGVCNLLHKCHLNLIYRPVAISTKPLFTNFLIQSYLICNLISPKWIQLEEVLSQPVVLSNPNGMKDTKTWLLIDPLVTWNLEFGIFSNNSLQFSFFISLEVYNTPVGQKAYNFMMMFFSIAIN